MKRLILAATLLVMQTLASTAVEPIYDIKLKDIDGKDTTLAAYKGKAILIVNVASQCGYTKQYSSMEATWQKFKDKEIGRAHV